MTPTNDPSQMLRNAGLAVGFIAFAVFGTYWLLSLAHAQPIFQKPSVKTAAAPPSAVMIAHAGSIAPYTDYKPSDKQAPNQPPSGQLAQPAADPRPLPPTASPVARLNHETVPKLPEVPRTPRIPVTPEVPPPTKGYEYTPPPPRDDNFVHPMPGPGPASWAM